MRHLWSSLAGLAAAPLVWALIALGQGGSARLIEQWVRTGEFDSTHLIAPAGYLAAAGVLLGLLATLRVSPAGPLVAGVLLVTPYALMFADPFAVRNAMPAERKIFGETLRPALPLDNGTLLLIGALLLMAVFSVQRWRRWPAPAAAAEPAVEAPPPAGTPPAPEPAPTAEPRPPAPTAGREQTPIGDRTTIGPPGESPWLAPPRTAQRERAAE